MNATNAKNVLMISLALSFSGHHQPLKVWILCLYFMGLNLSNSQIAQELDLNRTDAQEMTTQLREGIVKKARNKALWRG